jgi:hypothetical protein
MLDKGGSMSNITEMLDKGMKEDLNDEAMDE